jgi:hypothetical protein
MVEITGEWRKLHDDELHNLYYSPSIRVIKSKRVTLVGHVVYYMGEMINVYKILPEKPEGKRPL